MKKTKNSEKIIKPQRRKRGKTKNLVQYEVDYPEQLKLFELSPGEKDYSQSIELYDFIPKYFWGRADRLNGKFLDNLQREFECRGRRYSLTLMPARIETKDGSFKEFYPAHREEIVEDALRKMMTESRSLMLDGEAGIVFTLYQLQKELKAKKHTFSYDEIKDSIRILNSVDIVLRDQNEQQETAFSPIESYGFAGEGAETRTYVRFSPLVTNSIKSGTFRLINYDKAMSLQLIIARQLHKRMSHHFIQASFTNPYEILTTTIIRDFGLTPQKRLQQNLAEIEKSIEELEKKNIILNAKVHKIFQFSPRLKLIDAKFSIQPHPVFIDDIKRANARAKKVRTIITGTEEENY